MHVIETDRVKSVLSQIGEKLGRFEDLLDMKTE
jgi:hypothetical protein